MATEMTDQGTIKRSPIGWVCGGCGKPCEQVGAGWKHVERNPACPYPFNERRA